MLGLIHAEEENPDRKINAADETEIPAVPFNEAMQFLKSKVPMSKAEWLELEPKLRFRAFTVAQLGSAEVVDKAKQILLKSFEKGGGTYSDTWEELKKKVNVNALDIKPGYWENVFRTNTQSAYIAGKLQQYENSNVAAYQLMVIELIAGLMEVATHLVIIERLMRKNISVSLFTLLIQHLLGMIIVRKAISSIATMRKRNRMNYSWISSSMLAMFSTVPME